MELLVVQEIKPNVSGVWIRFGLFVLLLKILDIISSFFTFDSKLPYSGIQIYMYIYIYSHVYIYICIYTYAFLCMYISSLFYKFTGGEGLANVPDLIGTLTKG